MKVEAIKHVAACACAGIEPSESEQNEALAEAVDLAIGLVANVERIAAALERLADCVAHPNSEGVTATFGTQRH